MTNLHELHQLGQSTWLNYMRRAFIEIGELSERIHDGIQAVTANATIFERAITTSDDYNLALRRLVEAGTPARRMHEALVIDDVQRAADILHPIFEASNGLDGFASLELDPAVSHDATQTVAHARRITALLDRGNVMVEVPATPEGIEAIEKLIADGVSINATHIFSVDLYEKAAQAYINGLETYFHTHSVWRIAPAAVASFSLNALDKAVDAALAEKGREDLQGKTAVALAKLLYNRFEQIFAGPRWEKLAQRGARVLRPKWTRTTPLDFRYAATHYTNALIGPDTVMTFTPAALNAFLREGRVAPTLTEGLTEAQAHLEQVAALGIDLDAIGAKLQRDHLVASDNQFQELIHAVSRKRDEIDSAWRRMEPHLGAFGPPVEEAVNQLCNARVMCRIWRHDHTVWKPQPQEIANRLGWLNVMEVMDQNAARLKGFTQELLQAGFEQAVLLGMGGSSLAPELFHKTFGKPSKPAYMPHPYLDLLALDTTDADAVTAVANRINLSKTLFIVATKSGGTVETLSGFKYFYNLLADEVGQARAGAHFVAITDPGSSLVDLARAHNFRDIFLNDPNIGGRYSALSFFGLLPAALVGVDLPLLLARAEAMAVNTHSCSCAASQANLGAYLGTALGQLAKSGRDKVTFITSLALSSFGDWAEQLIAESTGKEGQGILPVVGEPPAAPALVGDDRLFIHLRLNGDASHDAAVQALAAAGHPVIVFNLKDLYDIGGQFFLWEMATAVAGHHLAINPFDQPNVESAKVRAREMVAAYLERGALPEGRFAPLEARALDEFLADARPGDYIALQAYTPPTPEMDAALHNLRVQLRARTKLAVTVGYGPRFLHSTGQLHKGDAGNGLFIQFVSDAAHDVAIPDRAGAPEAGMTFDVLKKAQALGDAQALRDAKRRLIRFHLGANPAADLQKLL